VPGPQQKVPVEERLFSLVLALLATEIGLTKGEILSTVQGYRQRYVAEGDNANLERQFERDKDDLRELGVPIETVDSPGQAGNNQVLRYRIPRGSYELPLDVRFTAEETTLLNLAGRVWREGSLSSDSRRALLKLRSLGVDPDEPLLGYAPRVRVRDAAFEPAATAIERAQIVSFPYLKPGERRAQVRLVKPLALIAHEGRWHLFAEQVEGGQTRTFLLRRIVGPVKPTGKTFTAPMGDQTERGLAQLEAVWRERVAIVAAEPGTDAAMRLANRRGTVRDDGHLSLHYADLAILADELAGYGPEVRVVSPPELVSAVVERLTRIAADHGGADA
jgi:proteasome accessory factor B